MKKSHYFYLSIIFSFILGFVLPDWRDFNPEITSDEVQMASHLLALDFNEAEVDSMLSGLERARSNYQDLHKIQLDNSVLPSLVFNPLPANFHISTEQRPVVFETFKDVEIPVNLNEIAFYSIGQLASLIENRKITSVELTQFFIERLKKYDDTLHCVISLTETLAMEQAARVDEEIAHGNYKGLLHGIPFGAKDLFAVPNYPTTWGAEAYRDQVLNEKATVIQKLEDAGAILIAKLSMGALAWGDVWFDGKTRNPWDPSRGSSGSSAGPASAVSAGLVPFALGTETLGSIVSPSTVCGTTGLRPTFGRVSRYGAMALSWSMDKIGPICRSVEDCAIVFNTIRGKDEKDPSTRDADFNYTSGQLHRGGLKIGYLKSVFESGYPFKTQDSLALEQIHQMGFELIPIELPEMSNIRFILDAEAATAFDQLTLSNKDDLLVRQIKNAWPNVFRTSRFIPAVEYLKANRLRSVLIEEMAENFRKVDLYLTPSWRGRNLAITNLTGHPQVVLPNGYRDGRPTSISIVGKLYDEATLLQFAKIYQDHTDFHKIHPPLFTSSE